MAFKQIQQKNVILQGISEAQNMERWRLGGVDPQDNTPVASTYHQPYHLEADFWLNLSWYAGYILYI